MPQISHAYAVGRVRSLEKSLLSKQTIERMLAAQSAQEAARTLSEAGWGDAQNVQEVDALAQNHMRNACALVRECTPDPDITDCFLLKFDILNLKTLVKARLMGQREPVLSPNGILNEEKLRHAVAEGKYSDLPEEYQETMAKIEQRVAVEADPLYIDAQLDKLLYRLIATRLRRAKHVPDEIRAYFAAKADSVNLLIAMRVHDMGKSADFAKDLFVEGGCLAADLLARIAEDPGRVLPVVERMPYAPWVKRGMERYERGEGLAPLEKQFDDYEVGLIRPGRYQVTSILPVIGYLLARERETAAVRLIVTAKSVNASEEALAARLRELYA